MGCQGNELIVPSPSVDFTSNNQILKYLCPYYKNMWVYKNPIRGDDFTFWPMDYKDEARKTAEAQVAATEDEDGRAETIRKRAMEGLSKGCCFILKTHLLSATKLYPYS